MGAWAILTELLGLMDEPTYARRVMAELADRHVQPEHRPLVVDAAACFVVPGQAPGERALTTVCRFDTPCGVAAEGAVFFEPLTCAITTSADWANHHLGVCPEMLTEEARHRLDECRRQEQLLLSSSSPAEQAP